MTPPVLVFSPAARATWIASSDHVEAQLGPNGELNEISGFANKMAEQAARIAAVLTKFEDPDATEIDELMVSRGIMLAQHYADAALRLHGASKAVWDLQEAKRLLEWLHQKWAEPLISIREIVRHGPNSLRDSRSARKLVDVLVQHRWLILVADVAIVAGQRTREAWRIVRP